VGIATNPELKIRHSLTTSKEGLITINIFNKQRGNNSGFGGQFKMTVFGQGQ